MADILLTHSYHLYYDRKQAKRMQPYPPLGTLYAAAALRAAGRSVAVFDSMLQEPVEGFREALRTNRPKLVAIYEDDFNFLTKMCLTRMRELAWQMIEQSRRFGAEVVVHGSDATDHAADYLRHGAQGVLIGESENTLAELAAAQATGKAIGTIPGVMTLRHSDPTPALAFEPRRPQRPNVALPWPARDLIDLSPYRDAWRKAHGFHSTNIVSSRGCPFACNWCAKPVFGNAFQVRDAASVAAEMQTLRDTYGAEHLWFADDIFGLNKHWVENLAREVETRDCAVPFKIQARADLLTADTAEALRRAGCAEVWMGVESGSQKILDAMDKGLRVEDVRAARNHLKKAGIRACFFLQFGYPGETWTDLRRTIDLVRETRPDDVGISVSYPLPNTKFYARVRQQMGRKRNWADSEDLCVMFKGAYTDQFYRSVRDALHAEVDTWKGTGSKTNDSVLHLADAWKQIDLAEPQSRNADATEPWFAVPGSCGSHPATVGGDPFISISNAALMAGDN